MSKTRVRRKEVDIIVFLLRHFIFKKNWIFLILCFYLALRSKCSAIEIAFLSVRLSVMRLSCAKTEDFLQNVFTLPDRSGMARCEKDWENISNHFPNGLYAEGGMNKITFFDRYLTLSLKQHKVPPWNANSKLYASIEWCHLKWPRLELPQPRFQGNDSSTRKWYKYKIVQWHHALFDVKYLWNGTR